MNKIMNKTKLVLEDESSFSAQIFAGKKSVAGEVVFSTGMVGYPEALTDPSYKGQILILTYPIIGNYGVPDKKYFESNRLQVSGLVVSQYINTPSHQQSLKTLSDWFEEEKIPLIQVKDTRLLTKTIRTKGAMLGKIIIGDKIKFYDPNKENLVGKVSVKKPQLYGRGRKKIVLIDCGSKKNIIRNFVKRDVSLLVVPWDFNPFEAKIKFDALVISNGPGDPKMADRSIETVEKALKTDIPILGICLGNQILSLAAGGDTYKLKYGHRSQNQPCTLIGSERCFITTQNHGFAVGKTPKGFREWFTNTNDGTNEGIIHNKKPIMSVQFHPEATPGPTDTNWIFDHFLQFV